jgi:hypothetical protein
LAARSVRLSVLYTTRDDDKALWAEVVADRELPSRLYRGRRLRMFRTGDREFGIADQRILRTRWLAA